MLQSSPEFPNGDWCVYLLALRDCSAFKVGFSCNPMQRIHSFSRRYFERFDLHRSLLLRVGGQRAARALETTFKTELAAFGVECPHWFPLAAGGHTEWFAAMQFSRAEALMHSAAAGQGLSTVADFLRGWLGDSRDTFELWAYAYAQRLCDDLTSVSLGYAPTLQSDLLRDWLDAYGFLELPLYADDPAAREFVVKSVERLRGG